MPGSTFLIEELDLLGGVRPPGGFQRFEWDEDHRNIPYKPWTFGVQQRNVRTDYPGADDPTTQVLGPNFTPFSVEGMWDDRYNARSVSPDVRSGLTQKEFRALAGGYAVEEWQRFEMMVRRGNMVRITFESVVIQGLVENFEVDYHDSSMIGYRFTFSPHHRQPGGFFQLRSSPRTVLNVQQLRDEVYEELSDAQALHEFAPTTNLVGTLYLDVDELMDRWAEKLAEIDIAIDQRQIVPDQDVAAALLRMAQLFYGMSAVGLELLDLLYATDSDEALGFENGQDTIKYNVWAKGIQYQARRMIVVGHRAAAELQQRANPNALALYRPYEGEHLYAIANRFYGNAASWRAIADRNGLVTYTLEGTELLIIPEVNVK